MTCKNFSYILLQQTHCIVRAQPYSHMFSFQNSDTPTQDSDVSTYTHAVFAYTHTHTKSPEAERGACWLCLNSLESSRAERERDREMKELREGGRDKRRYCCHFSFSPLPHRFIPVPGSRSVEEEEEAAKGVAVRRDGLLLLVCVRVCVCVCVCVCVEARDSRRGVYLCRDQSLKHLCLCSFNSPPNICHTTQCFQYQIQNQIQIKLLFFFHPSQIDMLGPNQKSASRTHCLWVHYSAHSLPCFSSDHSYSSVLQNASCFILLPLPPSSTPQYLYLPLTFTLRKSL